MWPSTPQKTWSTHKRLLELKPDDDAAPVGSLVSLGSLLWCYLVCQSNKPCSKGLLIIRFHEISVPNSVFLWTFSTSSQNANTTRANRSFHLHQAQISPAGLTSLSCFSSLSETSAVAPQLQALRVESPKKGTCILVGSVIRRKCWWCHTSQVMVVYTRFCK